MIHPLRSIRNWFARRRCEKRWLDVTPLLVRNMPLILLKAVGSNCERLTAVAAHDIPVYRINGQELVDARVADVAYYNMWLLHSWSEALPEVAGKLVHMGEIDITEEGQRMADRISLYMHKEWEP